MWIKDLQKYSRIEMSGHIYQNIAAKIRLKKKIRMEERIGPSGRASTRIKRKFSLYFRDLSQQ